ncbi:MULTISPECIES: benzoate/H(+) symporter BenE family transporter [unclassified Sphingopyxis]|uniref:benzoate/H(+) symporter BenE family transporter n=1 Tax=unclassified Sphingopyxis TaxID=2614943 RepID=UPI0006C4CCDC|nr:MULTISPECIES: benzoate/H(+) symporter BenE family transporter [unclassified Sphingopyxis]USI78517.1 benzoate/H(+) symporter BenE family transporter [Sphingopyxis sp. USTB-05]GAO79071.1 benzoate transport protein [Sphingopyxis sp. C-1]
MLRSIPPVPAWSSALIAALVGFGGTIALVVQAMRNLGASAGQTGSAVTALCLGIALAGAALSWRLRMPVVLAWSTPGAALLAATASGLSWPVAIGIFLSAALMMILLGIVPALGRLAERIPPSIASAMLAGVLLPFCLKLFALGAADPLLVALLVAIFVAARARFPLYALLLALAAGMALTLLRGDIGPLAPGATFGTLVPVAPAFDVRAILSVGVPLFLVTLVSQNLPGLVVLRSAGYAPPPRPLIIGSGVAWLAAAPFGAHGLNLAAITAAICTAEEAHPDRAKRWIVGMLYAGFYLLLAIFSPLLVRVFLALPPTVIAALAGVALIPALLGAMEAMFVAKADRDPAILTFLATGSGLTLFGLGSAFWGLVVGFLALAAGRWLAARA